MALNLDRLLDATDDQHQRLAREGAVECGGWGRGHPRGIFDEGTGGSRGGGGSEARDHRDEIGARVLPSRGRRKKREEAVRGRFWVCIEDIARDQFPDKPDRAHEERKKGL